jgi:hypothetical protein
MQAKRSSASPTIPDRNRSSTAVPVFVTVVDRFLGHAAVFKYTAPYSRESAAISLLRRFTPKYESTQKFVVLDLCDRVFSLLEDSALERAAYRFTPSLAVLSGSPGHEHLLILSHCVRNGVDNALDCKVLREMVGDCRKPS